MLCVVVVVVVVVQQNVWAHGEHTDGQREECDHHLPGMGGTEFAV